MRRGSADFDVRAVRLEVPCQWILGLAATAAAPAILLSLPHRLQCNPDKRLMPRLLPCPRCLLSARIFSVQVGYSLAPAALGSRSPGRARKMQFCCFALSPAPSR